MTLIVDEAADATGVQLARRLRLEREARGWSQAEVAARAGVAKGSVSKVERGEMSPTAALLVRLAGAFDLTLAGLLLRAEDSGERLTRAADQPVWRDPETGYARRQVFMRPDHPVELVEVTLPAGAQVRLPRESYRLIRQVVWVLDGVLELTEDGLTSELRAGDSLGFGPPADVTFRNAGAEPCRYAVALARS